MDQLYVFGTAAVIAAIILARAFRRDFDPFAPIWLFLVGYLHVYVLQAVMYRDYVLNVRGVGVTTAANARSLWAPLWFLAVYYSGLGKVIARWLPRAPRAWSGGAVVVMTPVLVAWGLACAAYTLARFNGEAQGEISGEAMLMVQFPTVQLVAGILLIVTGRQPDRPRPALTAAGVAVTLGYTLMWMFFGKRSHSLFGVLTGLCAWYVPRFRRPALGTLAGVAFVGSLVVAVAIGWRVHHNRGHGAGVDGFVAFVSDFDPKEILVSLNLREEEVDERMEVRAAMSRETKEYGGYLLMLDTVPHKAGYDYGSTYIRLVSTYIPRMIWGSKPIYGRAAWNAAWTAGSEFKRDETFTGPSIGILGAQLNGGTVGTLLVMGAAALVIRAGYDYFRYHADSPWAQAWWALTYFNAWLMTVNDNPAVWFYYLYGHMIFPFLGLLWVSNRLGETQG